MFFRNSDSFNRASLYKKQSSSLYSRDAHWVATVEDIIGPTPTLQAKQSDPFADNNTQQVKPYCENEINDRGSPRFYLFVGIARTRY